MLDKLDFLIAFITIISGVSLLITIWVQAVSWILGLRGRDLQEGLIKTFKAVVSESEREKIESHLVELTKAILAEGPLSHGVMAKQTPFLPWQHLATAVRPSEVIARLEQLREHAAELGEEADERVKGIGAAAAAILDSFPDTNKEVTAAQSLIGSLKEELEELGVNPDAPVSGLLKSLEKEVEVRVASVRKDLESWLHSSMDRVQQKFASQTRFWTIVGSILAAWFLQLDAFRIWEDISNDTKARNQLVATASVMIDQAAETLEFHDSLSPEFSQEVMEKMKMEGELSDNQEQILEKLIAEKDMPRFVNESDRSDYLRRFGDAAFLNSFEETRRELAKEKLEELIEQQGTLVASFEDAGFSLLPKSAPPLECSWNSFARWIGVADRNGNSGWANSRSFFGMGITAALLTLGAPFWFNLLKTLTSLRPYLAQKVEEEPKA